MEQALISAYTLEALDNGRREIAAKKVYGFWKEIKRIGSLYFSSVENELLDLLGR